MKKYMYVGFNSFTEVAFFRDEKGNELQFKLHEIQEARNKYGGSFLKCLAELLTRADLENTQKIIDTWNNYIIQFYQQRLLKSYKLERGTISYKKLGIILSDKLNELAEKDGYFNP